MSSKNMNEESLEYIKNNLSFGDDELPADIYAKIFKSFMMFIFSIQCLFMVNCISEDPTNWIFWAFGLSNVVTLVGFHHDVWQILFAFIFVEIATLMASIQKLNEDPELFLLEFANGWLILSIFLMCVSTWNTYKIVERKEIKNGKIKAKKSTVFPQ
ncbi:unnamed protein product [Caenorhabditis angaria]|uniref:Transmembrane protein n=1 Tax=Caenorhabditis angaria TaxID=860376 RepID=A0A9P1IH60_9PELO|nr:unnamed protein product [Caenorhabditis angaria]